MAAVAGRIVLFGATGYTGALTARALDANEGLIREMVHKRANWVLKLAGLDAKLADAIVDGLRKLSADMHTDPAHPVRIKIEQALADLVAR